MSQVVGTKTTGLIKPTSGTKTTGFVGNQTSGLIKPTSGIKTTSLVKPTSTANLLIQNCLPGCALKALFGCCAGCVL